MWLPAAARSALFYDRSNHIRQTYPSFCNARELFVACSSGPNVLGEGKCFCTPVFARPYSDVTTMLQRRNWENASHDLPMLEDVYSASEHYELALSGSLIAIPNSKKLRDLTRRFTGVCSRCFYMIRCLRFGHRAAANT